MTFDLSLIPAAEVGSLENQPNWAEVSTLFVSIAVALATTAVAIFAYRLERERARRIERKALQATLRSWFQGLSDSASRPVKKDNPRLRSLADETIDAEEYVEIVELMEWAVDMHSRSRTESLAGRLSADEAHVRRIIVKRRFRQMLARWAASRRKGRKLIRRYTAAGWPAIIREPASAVNSSTALDKSF